MSQETSYLTVDNTRQRYIFQIRIPVPLVDHYSRTVQRKLLGKMNKMTRDEAQQLASQLATQYLAEFAQLLADIEEPVVDCTVPVTQLIISNLTPEQFSVTWQHQAAQAFQVLFGGLKNAPADQWDTAIASLEQEVVESREALRRQKYSLFESTLAAMQAEYRFHLVGTEADKERVARSWYAARRDFAQNAISVLKGDKPLDELFPDITTGLPLVMLWGTQPRDLPELWAKRKAIIGVPADPKTLDKYRGIAADLEDAMPGRSAESISHPDLENLKQLWLERGNKSPTISDKLRILQTMMGKLPNKTAIQKAFDAAKVAGYVKRTKRLPFTREQVRSFLNGVITDGTLPEDDKILVLLLLLTGSRLEEICQLVSEDITRDRANWTFRLAFGEDTGTDAQLKNSASARRLMIPFGVIPILDTWLDIRCTAEGRIFPGLQPDKYGKLSGAVSKRLNGRVKKFVGVDRRIVLLSTRPTSGRVLRRANVDPRVRQRQLGHADVSIHDQHYDPAEYFDDEDLIPAAQVLADWVLDCIQGETTLGIDTGSVIDYLPRLELAADISTEAFDTPTVKEHAAFEDQQPDTLRFTRLHSQGEALVVEALDCPSSCAANENTVGNLPDFQLEMEKDKTLALSIGDIGFTLEFDVRHLERACDDEFSRFMHAPTARDIPAHRPLRSLFFKCTKPLLFAHEVVEWGVDISPYFETAQLSDDGQAAIQADLACIGINVVEQLKPLDQISQHAILEEETGHARVCSPDVSDVAIPGIQQQVENLGVVHGNHVKIEFAAPIQHSGNSRARLSIVPEFFPDTGRSNREFEERRDTGIDDFEDKFKSGVGWSGGIHDGKSFLVLDDGKFEREAKVMDSLRKALQRHLAVKSSNAGRCMSGKRIVNFLGNIGSSTQGFEGVPEGVEDDSRVGQVEPTSAAQVAPEPSTEIFSSSPVVVGLELREKPFMPGIGNLFDVVEEACADQFLMERDDAARGDGLEGLPFPFVGDTEKWSETFVSEDVCDSELGDFFQPTTRCQSDERHPGGGLTSCATRTPLTCIDGR